MRLSIIFVVFFVLFILSSCAPPKDDEDRFGGAQVVTADPVEEKIRVNNGCKEYCNYLTLNLCDKKDMIRFCEAYYVYDLNGNYLIDESRDKYNLAICEDRVYCPIIFECSCDKIKLDLKTCNELINNYYANEGKNDDKKKEIKYSDGACEETNAKSWTKIYFN
ncbi:MAG: hypothetical protein KC589_02050 [Nanoarchaeota archaeon]|nr:hypothetical protein [Nanoarchaeota archaeon]